MRYIVVLVAIGILIAGCSEQKDTLSGSIVITDATGRDIAFENPPERVIVLTSYWAETIQLLGAEDKIVGIGNYVANSEYIKESLRNKPKVGSIFKGLNWEAVVALDPDLIISDWYGGKYGDSELIDKAEELGIKVVALQPKSVEDNIECVKILGKIFKREEKAEEIANFMDSKLKEIKEISKEDLTKKKVFVISAPKDVNAVTVYARGSSWGSIPELVGGHNVAYDINFSTEWPKLDLERIIAWWNDTDVLIVISYSDDGLNKALESIKSDERWREIKAVKEGRVYGILAGGKLSHFLDWGPRIIVGVYQFGCAINPEKFPRWQKVADELLKFYNMTFYNTIVDFEGRKVRVPMKVERAVILAGQAAELLFSWGDFDKIVGITKWGVKNPVLNQLTDVENIPVVGGGRDPNVEAIVSLNPDVVITYGGEYGYSTPKTAIEQLENAGIPVVLIELNNLDDVYRSIEIVGKVFGRQSEANDTVEYMKQTIGEIKLLTDEIPEKERVKALWLWSKPNKVTGNSGVTNDLIVNAGAINPAAEVGGKYVEVSMEKIVEWNPDVLIIWSSAKYTPEDLINDPKWQNVNAIKLKRVYKQPEILADTWSIRVAILQVWMFDKFYPGKIDFFETANEFFEHFYGVSYSQLQGW